MKKRLIDGIYLERKKAVLKRKSRTRQSFWLWQKLWLLFVGLGGYFVVFWRTILTRLPKLRIKNKNKVLVESGKIINKYGYALIIITVSTFLSLTGWLLIGKIYELKDGVVEAAGVGIENVKTGMSLMKNEQFVEAADKFAQAESSIENIRLKIGKTGYNEQFLNQSIAGNQLDEMNKLLDGCSALVGGGKYMAMSLEEIKTIDNSRSFGGLFFAVIMGDIEKEGMFSQLSRASEYLNLSREKLNLASDKLSNINAAFLPDEYKQVYEENVQEVPKYLNILKGLNTMIANSGFFLGKNVPAKYLILFQNTNEVRPTGGFIGSYAILTMNGGVMEEIKFDDVYNPDGQIIEKIQPPYPIWYMTDEWGMRDSNWDPNFPDSAKQAVKMFEKGGGYTVDGVVAITPQIVVELLKLTGPIYMEQYDVELTSENFLSVVQEKVELDYDKVENKPKQILSDLLPLLLQRLRDLGDEKRGDLWLSLMDLLNKKDIMIYFYDNNAEDMIQQIGWGGEVKNTSEDEDYLYMVHANIGGRKSDEFIKESVSHRVTVESDGSLVVDLEIIRRNVDDWSWPNYPNFDYLRVYVPEGSELLEVDGFVNPEGVIINSEGFIDYDSAKGESGLATTKSYTEHGKQVWANWIVTYPVDASRVRYKYRLPKKVNNEYKLYVQKQPGRHDIVYKMIFDSGDKKISNNLEKLSNDGLWIETNDMVKDWNVKLELD